MTTCCFRVLMGSFLIGAQNPKNIWLLEYWSFSYNFAGYHHPIPVHLSSEDEVICLKSCPVKGQSTMHIFFSQFVDSKECLRKHCACMTAQENTFAHRPPFVCIWFKINSVKIMQKHNSFQGFGTVFLRLVSLTLHPCSSTTFQVCSTSDFCKQERLCSQPCV